MQPKLLKPFIFIFLFAGFTSFQHLPVSRENDVDNHIKNNRHYLYVAVPGIRDYLEYGGHGLLIFDMDNNFKFVKRIKTAGLGETGLPMNVKGIAVSLATHSIYISTLKTLIRLDLQSEKMLWEKSYEGGCDRMSISPDGKTIYLPSLEGPHWNIVDAASGDVINKIVLNSAAHNTVCGPSGSKAYLAGLKSSYLTVLNTRDTLKTQVGPFSASIRPFTINGSETLCFVNVNELLGFEVGDIRTGKKLYSIQVNGYKQGPVKRHGCPSHGIALTPDEKEIWLADAFNERLHIFDASVSPAKQIESIKVKDQPGWITVSIDGKYILSSTGDVIDARKHKIVASLKDENGKDVQSEKMVEVDFTDGVPSVAGDQFGLGKMKRHQLRAIAGN